MRQREAGRETKTEIERGRQIKRHTEGRRRQKGTGIERDSGRDRNIAEYTRNRITTALTRIMKPKIRPDALLYDGIIG